VADSGEGTEPGTEGGREAGTALERRLLEAVDKALRGDWQAAHVIVQEHEEDAIAAWIHAVVHRMEGDLGNARYWYRRCERPFREDVATDAELREIQSVLHRSP
jgi:hypothetical protein